MIDIEQVKPQIIKLLMPLKLDKIILFGSHAYGTPSENSDIDLYIVTNDNFMPQTWKEKSNIHLKISKLLKNISEIYSIDIITHTRAMHNKFVEMDSMFSRKILQQGIKLL